MRERPLVAFACCWLAGASLPSLWPGYGQALAFDGLLLLLLACLLSGLLGARLSAACLAALLMAWAERTCTDRNGRSELSALWQKAEVPGSAGLSGTVSSAVDIDGDTVSFRLSASRLTGGKQSEPAKIRETVLVRVKLKERAELTAARDWKRGDAMKVAGKPERPSDAGNFGAFDYRKYLERQGVHWQWSVSGADNVKPQRSRVPLRMLPLRAADDLRSGISRLMDRLYPGDDAGYMKGLVAGITRDVDPAQYDTFSKLGLTHVLAISGLHVGVVVFLLLRIGALIRLTRERSIDLAFAAMPVYMLATGASPSAVRACLMAMIALALARRRLLRDGLHLLSAAALLMTVADPAVVENVSFQLSFAVTAGLILATPVVSRLLEGVRPAPLRGALAVAVTAQAVSFPLTVYYFHAFHLLSLPANLLLVPFISFVVMPLGMMSLLLGWLWFPLGVFPAALASYGNRLTFWAVDLLEHWSSWRTIWPQPSKLWAAAAYLLIGVTVWYLKRMREERLETEWRLRADDEDTVPLEPPASRSFRFGRKAAGALVLLLWGGWLLWGYRPSFLDRDALVSFIDVGQGDGILIRTGSGKHILVDTGGSVRFAKPGDEWRQKREPYDIGSKLLVPILQARGVRRLDALVLTHLDADHIGGAEAVLRNIPVRAVVWNGTWKESAAARRLFEAAQRRRIPVYAASAGMTWRIDRSALLEVLYPDRTPPAAGPVLPVLAKQNQRSIVMTVTLYGRRFLLTGDMETPAEEEIVRRVRSGDQQQFPPADVMKAAHHGSKTSTAPDWLSLWRPGEVVISVGRGNPYGHPNPVVVSRIERFGSLLLRTDRDGEIQYRVAPDGGLARRRKRQQASWLGLTR